MTTSDALRARYGKLTDEALLSLLASHNSDGLTSDEFRVLTEEIARRSLGKPAPTASVDRAPPAGPPYAKAPLELRLLAGVIDLAIVVAAYAVLATIVIVMESSTPELLARLVFYVGLIPIAYYVLLRDGRPGGASVGKRFAGLMVVSLRTGRPCDARDSATRSLLFVLCYFLPAFAWLVEPLAMIADREGQRFGDKAASTQVIEVSGYSGETAR